MRPLRAEEQSWFSFFRPCQSLHSNRDCVARPAKVSYADGDGGSRRNAVWHAGVDLVETCISRRLAEEQDFGHPAADGDLRRDHASVTQASAVNQDDVACN